MLSTDLQEYWNERYLIENDKAEDVIINRSQYEHLIYCSLWCRPFCTVLDVEGNLQTILLNGLILNYDQLIKN